MNLKPRTVCLLSTLMVIAIFTGLGASAGDQTAKSYVIEQASGSSQDSNVATVESQDSLTEIVVVARKRSENLQVVPIAATVMSAADIDKQSVLTMDSLGLTIPGFKIAESSAVGAAPIIMIRGQVEGDIIATLDPSVGVYVDGVYWSRAAGADAALVDLQSIEVLKGPQGTLFGRNTTGGALNIRTSNPDVSEYAGTVSATAGAYNEFDQTLIFNAPLIRDVLGVRLAVNHNEHDGYAYNTVLDTKVDSKEDTTFRVKVLAEPTEDLRFLLSYENFLIVEDQTPSQLDYVNPQGAALFLANLTTGTGLSQYIGGNPRLTQANNTERQDTRTQTVSLSSNYDLGSSELKFIGAYRQDYSSDNLDLDGTPLTLLTQYGETQTDEFTGELQFIGQALDERLKYVAGYFWFAEHGYERSTAYALVPINPDNPSFIDGDIRNRSQAGYFQGTYKLTDALSITGGVRYTADNKVLVSHNATGSPTGDFCTVPDAVGATNPALCSQYFQAKSSDPDYTVSLDYAFTDDIFGYLKVAHGYRAGGDNLRGSITPASFAPFAPETALNYEVGLKSEFFEHKLRVNIAAYYTDYKDIQRSVLVQTATGGVATFIANAAAGKVYGGEVEAQALVYKGLRLGTSLGVIQAHYDSYEDLLGNHVNEPFPFTPEFQYSLTADYSHMLPLGTANLHMDWGWQSRVTFPTGFTNGGTTSPNFPTDTIAQGSYGLLNAKLSWLFEQQHLELALYGRNITNRLYRISAIDLVDAGLGFNSADYGPPVTYGGQVTYKF